MHREIEEHNENSRMQLVITDFAQIWMKTMSTQPLADKLYKLLLHKIFLVVSLLFSHYTLLMSEPGLFTYTYSLVS